MNYTDINQIDNILDGIRMFFAKNTVFLNIENFEHFSRKNNENIDKECEEMDIIHSKLLDDGLELIEFYFNNHDNAKDPNYRLIRLKLNTIKDVLRIVVTDNEDSWINKELEVKYLNFLGCEITSYVVILQIFERNILEKLQEIESFSRTNDELQEFKPSSNYIIVMLLYELGIFDFLINKFEDMNPSKLAQIVQTFTGLKQDTIRQDYREIIGERYTKTNPFNDPKKKTELNNIMLGLNLRKKG